MLTSFVKKRTSLTVMTDISTFFDELILVLSRGEGTEGMEANLSNNKNNWEVCKMEMTMKTKEVSEILGVNPTTVQRWAKYFDLVCETNENGHYLFTEEHVDIMRGVQRQLQQGKRMKDITINGMESPKTTERSTKIETALYEGKLEEVMNRVQELDHRLSQKADEVVSYQLLKHRSELDDMMKMIVTLEERLTKMESKMQPREESEERELPMVVGGNVSRKKWRSFMQMFSF